MSWRGSRKDQIINAFMIGGLIVGGGTATAVVLSLNWGVLFG